MKSKFINFSLIILAILFFTAASDSCLSRWEKFSHSTEKTKLTIWMRNTAENILTKNKNSSKFNFTLPAQPECTGLFVTLIRNGKVRGCYGAFSHSYNSPAEILKDYIKSAIYTDPRHTPLERYELNDTEIVLTVTSNPEPVNDINNVDISNFGLFIECEDSSKTVVVPAEYRTTSKVTTLINNRRCRFKKFHAVTIR